MGIVEGYALGQLQSQVEGAHQDIVNTFDNVSNLHKKMDSVLQGHFVPMAKYNELVDNRNRLVKQFVHARSLEVGNYAGREAAMKMISDLTGRERQDILENVVRGPEYRNHPDVAAKVKEYEAKREQEDIDAGIMNTPSLD